MAKFTIFVSVHSLLMTKKQQNIISAAIELFSKDGFHATSTSKIAKHAEVSEGLIFRHFKNKEGLIQSIFNLNEAQLTCAFDSILEEEDSKQLIKKALELPFIISNQELEHWRLHYKMKWELNQSHSKTMEELEVVLMSAFTKLKYKKPQLETELILNIIKSMIASILKDELQNENLMSDFLIQKYHLN